MRTVIFVLVIFDTLLLIFLTIFVIGMRLAEMRVKRFSFSQPNVIQEGRIEFPPPPTPPEEEVISGSAVEEANLESPFEESAEEREYYQEQKRILNRGQV